MLSLVPSPEVPTSRRWTARGWEPVLGDAGAAGGPVAAGRRRVLGHGVRRGRGAPSGWPACWARRGCRSPVVVDPTRPGRRGRRPGRAGHPGRGGPARPGLRGAGGQGGRAGRGRRHRAAAGPPAGPGPGPARRRFFDDLAPGDYVVHRQHGVARYGGMVTRTVSGAARDYLLLEYRGDDKLYLPSDQIDAAHPLQRRGVPALNRLGGSEWQRTRAKARAAVHEIAEELVELYRRRLQSPATPSGPTRRGSASWRTSFAFTETPDQVRAIDEVKADMERAAHGPPGVRRRGFGKTEVAVRAVFKAVQDGKQAAVLVPTTLLASQHAQTFADRYAGYPVRVEMLSRFLTPAQAREVVAGLADGSVDVVVGHAPAAGRRHHASRTSACWWSTRSSASG